MTATRTSNPFLSDSVLTASPERLLVMLYDRLALDIERGQVAISRGDAYEAHERLTNAQAIVSELRNTLDVEVWPEGKNLVAIYDYLFKLLVDANVYKDATLAGEAATLVAPLRDAWRQAATLAVTSHAD